MAAPGVIPYANGNTMLIWNDAAGAEYLDSALARITVKGSDTTGGTTRNNKPGMGAFATDGRFDVGYGGSGGGNLEIYSKGHGTRSGQFKFIYGGGPNMGKVAFTHYDGTGYPEMMALDPRGNLWVKGAINSSEVLVQVQPATGWPDYVFEDNYPLMPLEDLDQFIQTNGHLPGVVTQAEVKEKGVNIGEVSAQLLKKVEELTLYVIDLKKQKDELAAKVAQLEGQKAD